MKRTFQPSNLVRARRHGFRSRMATVGGRSVAVGKRAFIAQQVGREVTRTPLAWALATSWRKPAASSSNVTGASPGANGLPGQPAPASWKKAPRW